MRAVWPAILSAAFMLSPIAQAAPLQYLSSSGDKANAVVGLTWGLLLISVAVILVISVLLAIAIWRRPGLVITAGEKAVVLNPAPAMTWVWIGVGVSVLILLFSVAWTVKVLAQIAAPPVKPALTIEITGHQWWWQVRYMSDDPSRIFTTANEIHIPAGTPIRLLLIGGDVIHSFWVPQLSGKTDLIPGQTNETWLEARSPGIYRGQCTEYCGLQHAKMGIVMVVDTSAGFAAWQDRQRQSPAVELANMPGAQDFVTHCGGCHQIRGTDAAGTLGPDLSHLAMRHTIAAGALPNDSAHLKHWIDDPQNLKPGNLMPRPQLTDTEQADIEAYLDHLN